MIQATLYDGLAGTISVGIGNMVLNGVGKMIQIRKLEQQFSSMKRAVEAQPFLLPGATEIQESAAE